MIQILIITNIQQNKKNIRCIFKFASKTQIINKCVFVIFDENQFMIKTKCKIPERLYQILLVHERNLVLRSNDCPVRSLLDNARHIIHTCWSISTVVRFSLIRDGSGDFSYLHQSIYLGPVVCKYPENNSKQISKIKRDLRNYSFDLIEEKNLNFTWFLPLSKILCTVFRSTIV